MINYDKIQNLYPRITRMRTNCNNKKPLIDLVSSFVLIRVIRGWIFDFVFLALK